MSLLVKKRYVSKCSPMNNTPTIIPLNKTLVSVNTGDINKLVNA